MSRPGIIRYRVTQTDRRGRLLKTSRAFLADVPVAAERKAKGEGTEVYSPDKAEELPAYFLQNFHYQTGGYLTEDSAEIYDMQTEVLFSGSTNAMRRECLVPLWEFMRGRDQRQTKIADIACGTGRFGRFIKQAYPRIDLTLSDLSRCLPDRSKAPPERLFQRQL